MIPVVFRLCLAWDRERNRPFSSVESFMKARDCELSRKNNQLLVFRFSVVVFRLVSTPENDEKNFQSDGTEHSF